MDSGSALRVEKSTPLKPVVKKTYVLDTNVLLHDADSLSAFEEHNIVLTVDVLEELDRFKRQNDERGRNARQVIRTLDELRRRNNHTVIAAPASASEMRGSRTIFPPSMWSV